MKVITLQQPWGWAVIFGGKDVENRSQNLAGDYQGMLAIHAGLKWSLVGFASSILRTAWERFRRETPPPAVVGALRKDSLFLDQGRIVGVVDIVGTHHASTCHRKLTDHTLTEVESFTLDILCSAWAEVGAWHIELANPRPLTVPLLHRGAQGIRTLPASIEREVLARVTNPSPKENTP